MDIADRMTRHSVAADPAEHRRKLRELIAKLHAIGRAGEVGARRLIVFPERPGLY